MHEKKLSSNNLFIVDSRILQDSILSLEAKGVYCYLSSFSNDNKPSIEKIANDNKLSIDNVKQIISDINSANERINAKHNDGLDDIDFQQLATAESMRANYLPLSQYNVKAFGTFGAVLLAYLKDLEAFAIQGRDYNSQFVKPSLLKEYWDRQPDGFPVSSHEIAMFLKLDEDKVKKWIETFIKEGILVLLPPKGNYGDHYKIDNAQIIRSRYMRGVRQ